MSPHRQISKRTKKKIFIRPKNFDFYFQGLKSKLLGTYLNLIFIFKIVLHATAALLILATFFS